MSCFIIEPASSPANSPEFRVLPQGETGELAVGGHQLAAGYLNRPEQTASAFIPSPYGPVYRTGDKARLLDNGTIECLGRLSDGQVKLRGQRMELGEVEQALLRTDGCHSAVAAVVGSILVAFCGVDPGVGEEAVLGVCGNWLPRFMVPGDMVLMSDLPRLPSGKVDRKRLKTEYEEQLIVKNEDQGAEEPSDHTERTILALVSEALDVQTQSHTTLSSLGLDSLKAIRLASYLRENGFRIHAAELLTMKTTADLYLAAQKSRASDTPDHTTNISLIAELDKLVRQNPHFRELAESVEDILPCTDLQIGMLAETMRDGSAYWNELELEAAAGLGADQIRRAFDALTELNLILRTGFLSLDGRFVAVQFQAPPRRRLEVVDDFIAWEVSLDADSLLFPFRVQIQHKGREKCRVFVQIHHAVYDGWSMDMILSDLSNLLRGQQPPCRPPFSEVVRFYNSEARGQLDDQARAFWAEHFLGWSRTTFPRLNARPSVSTDIARIRDAIPCLPSDLERVAARVGCSPQCLFQAAVALIWSGITGSDDVTLGLVTSGRAVPVAGIEKIIGPCIASLPVRVDFSNTASLSEVLSSINLSNRAILKHSSLSLGELKRLVEVQSSESLYDVLFAYQQSLDSGRKSDNLIRETRHLDHLETKLLIEIEPLDDGYGAQATFHESAFKKEFVNHMVQQLKSILLHMLAHFDEPVQSARSSLDAGLSIYDDKPASLRSTPDLASVVEAAVRSNPDAAAICFAKSLDDNSTDVQTVTYKELNVRANRIARCLQAAGVNTGDVVVIIMDKSIDLYASILGIVKLGCAYLPLLPSTPVARVASIFKQAGVHHCLVDDGLDSMLRDIPNIEMVTFGRDSLRGFSDENLLVSADPSRLAYVIYTSGTTGEPKGVAVTQKNIVSNIVYLESIYPISDRRTSRFLQACSQAFDVSVFEIFFAWQTGMCLCTATNDVLFEDLEASIRQMRITHLSLTPTVAALIDPKNVPGVEFLVTAGEPMTRSVLDKWGQLLWQGYGPSETTNICTVKRMSPGEHIEHLGWTFPNTSVAVLFPDSLTAVPVGWVGEFCFGGDQVAHGYLNMQQMTADKFVQHPLLGRTYRSGDLGRMLPDGSLVILGRLDDQIKLRGQRIQSGEIDSVITTALHGTSVMTALVRRENMPEQLASFYVQGSSIETLQARTVDAETNKALYVELRSRLPSYMIPSYLIPVSQLPLTSSGKVDRRAILQRFLKLEQDYLSTTSDVHQAPDIDDRWTSAEQRLADAIAKSLRIPRTEVGRWTPLRSLGLDSITAISVSRDLRVDSSIRVSISALLQHAAVAQLARFLDAEPEAVESADKPVFSESFLSHIRERFSQRMMAVEEVLPCTPLQEAMLSSVKGAYFNKVLLRLHVPAEDMMRYWAELSRRHGILRTCFVTTDNAQRPVAQVILKNWDIPWQILDHDVTSMQAASDEHFKGLPEPLDSNEPPMSLALFSCEGSTFLSFVCHHALYDGVAMENLWQEVESMVMGREPLPPVPYGPVVKEMMNLPRDYERFWTDCFRGFRSSNVFSRSAEPPIGQSTVTVSLDMTLADTQDRVRALGVTLLSVLQASWASTLAAAGGMDDICFGNVVSGRTLDVEGIDRLVAPCFNTVPIRTDLSMSSQNIELVKKLHLLNQEIISYQFTPLRLVQRLVGGRGRRLFDTLLLLQQPQKELDRNVWTLEEDSGQMDIPLVCEILPFPGLNSVVVKLHHDVNVVSDAQAAAVAELFKHVLHRVLESPFSRLIRQSEIPALISSQLEGLVARAEEVEEGEPLQAEQGSWSEVELKVRRALAELSGSTAARIYRNTTIYQLGLDSINAVQVASLLRQQGLHVSASDVIECLNCSRIAQRCSDNSSRGVSNMKNYDIAKFSASVAEQVKAHIPESPDIEAILPCTPIQAAMLSSFVQSQGQNYFNALAFEMSDVNVDKLADAWTSLRSRHPMLRTGFLSIQHQDSAFAMIRYSAESRRLPLTKPDRARTTDYLRQDATKGLLRNMENPPWQVSIVDKGEKLDMTLLIHHALYDAYSLEIMLQDLSSMLAGQTVGDPLRIEPALSAIMSERHRHLAEAESIWKSKAEESIVNSFPVMTPLREPCRQILTYELLSRTTATGLHKRAKALEVSIQAIIQAAWTRVLASYLGEDSVVFGVTLSGRTMEDTRDAPFPCLVTLPVIASNQTSNQGLVNSMMDYNASLHRSQFAPLALVQKWLGHPGSPVFDTLISYQRLEERERGPRPWKLVKDEAVVEYPVSLEIIPVLNDGLRLCITHFSDVLPHEQARLLVKQFDATMQQISMNPSGTADDIYKTEPDLVSILPARTPQMPAPVSFLHQFVEMQATSTPDKPALEFVSGFNDTTPVKKTWTYRQLNQMGNRVANLLQSHTSSGSIIAIHFEKCPEAYFAILGILKAGCSFVALDPSAPKARKEFILKDSEAPCLLCKDATDVGFEVGTAVIEIDQFMLEACSPNAVRLNKDIRPDDNCYCLYTSGTTGTPKGCQITHENAVQAMMAFQELFSGHWSADSRCLQFAALHFDVSVLEQYWSWAVGITMVAAPRDLILEDLTASINRLEITHIDLTPSLARLTHPDEVPSLCKGVFITGGEQLKQEILDAWGPKGVIYNAYGPTEATIGVTMYQRVPQNGRPSNIGQQFPNVGSYVFKPETEIPVLRGGVGELCVSGKLVGKGYLNRPELTEARFPVLGTFAERVYRTGDLVRVLHDGCFDFLGRADDQVKLRGQRLEIGEINHVIRTEVAELRDVATIVTRHGSGKNDVLVSFFVDADTSKERDLGVLDDDDNLGTKIRDACRSRLPGYMVPTYFVRLSYIPLSSNNKAETKKLKGLFSRIPHEGLAGLTAIRDDSGSHQAVRKIIKVLAEFSNINAESISPSSTIFDLGIDSITALQLSTLLKKSEFSTCSPTTLLRNPVIADLASALGKKGSAPQPDTSFKAAKLTIQACAHRYRGHVCQELGVTSGEIEYIAPCSPLQQGIVSKALTDGSGIYFNSIEMRLDDNASATRLEDAWDKLVASNPILRTAFVNTPNGCVQVALKSKSLTRKHFTAQSHEEVLQVIESTREDWIDMNRDSIHQPLEVISISRGAERRLIIHAFHAIYDGNSFDLMLRHVSATYFRKVPPPVGPPFLDALAHGPLRSYANSREFWIGHLQSWSFSPTPSLSLSAEALPCSASRDISATMPEKIRKMQNVTLSAVVLGLWLPVLGKYHTGGVTVGVVVSGRSIELPGVESTIGPLFNTLPFFHNLRPGDSWGALMRECHSFNASTSAFQHVPLHAVQKWCSGGMPLFDSLFSYQVEPRNLTNEAVPWQLIDGPLNPDYSIAFEATLLRSGDVRLTLVAQGRIANVEKLEELLNAFEENVASAAQDANAQLDVAAAYEKRVESKAMTPDTSLGSDKDDHFIWTPQSVEILRNIASLSGISESDVTASTTVLELGLDSIDVIKLSAMLRRKGIGLSPSQIMRHQSVRQMSSSLGQESTARANGVDNDREFEHLQRKLWDYVVSTGTDMNNIEAVFPPTALQESMVAGMIHSDFAWYFNHDVFQVQGAVDLERLRLAFDQVVRQSPILRTIFIEVEDTSMDMAYCQVVSTETKFLMRDVHMNDLAELETLMDEARQQARAGNARSHLFQLQLATMGDQTFLIMSISHALYDGWSLDLLYQDLYAAYEGRLIQRPKIDTFLRKMMSYESEKAHDFWTSYLTGASPTHYPRAEPSAAQQGLFFQDRHSKINLQDIQRFCRNESISLQVLCLASWTLVLARHTGSFDVTFGVVLSGRDFEGVEDLNFPTINTVPMRCVLHGSTKGLLAYLEETMADIREFQGYPLRKAQTAAQVQGRALFNTLFTLQKSSEQNPFDQLLKSVQGSSALEYPVCVEAEGTGEILTWRAACQDGFVPETGVDELLNELDDALTFLTGSEVDVLSFYDDTVFSDGPLHKQDATTDTLSRIDDLESYHWDKTSDSIRMVLGQVSNTPVDQIQPSSTLYHLGLDSISAIKVSALLRKMNINIKPNELIAANSVSQMAEEASKARDHDGTGAKDTIPWSPPVDVTQLLANLEIAQHNVEAVLPALSMQVYMLSVWQNTNGLVFYPEFHFRIDDKIESRYVYAAWKTVVRQTPILRTVFAATDSRVTPFLQIVLKPDAVDNPDTIQPDTLQPMLKLHATQDPDTASTLVSLKMHHALYDGVSLPAILQRFSAVLGGGHQPPAAGDAEDDLRRWAGYTTRPALPAGRDSRMEFWAGYLKGCKTQGTEQPVTRPSRPRDRVAFFQRSAVADTATLRGRAAAFGISVQSLFLAAHAKVLADRENAAEERDETARGKQGYSGRAVVFGVYLANRGRAVEEELPETYPTLNLVPLRVYIPSQDINMFSIARAIQSDIQAINTNSRADIGLWEISSLTGITLSSFVNFLSTPEPTTASSSSSATARSSSPAPTSTPSSSLSPEPGRRAKVTLVPIADAAKASQQQPPGPSQGRSVGNPQGQVQAAASWIQANPVRDAFPVCFLSSFPLLPPSSCCACQVLS